MENTHMSKPTDSERLYVVETKLDTVLTAVEKTNSKIDELSTSLAKYATRAELEQAIIERNIEIASLKAADVTLSKRHTLNVWLTGIFGMAFGVGLTILINMAFR